MLEKPQMHFLSTGVVDVAWRFIARACDIQHNTTHTHTHNTNNTDNTYTQHAQGTQVTEHTHTQHTTQHITQHTQNTQHTTHTQYWTNRYIAASLLICTSNHLRSRTQNVHLSYATGRSWTRACGLPPLNIKINHVIHKGLPATIHP